MEERRQFKRYPIKLSASYLEDRGDKWNDCSIIDISSEGMRIKLFLHEKPNLNSMLQLEIIVPTNEKPIKVTSTLLWLKEIKEKTSFEGAISLTEMIVGGVKLLKIDDEDKRTLLDYAYADWSKERKYKSPQIE